MKIRDGLLEGFKRQASECIKRVKEKDTGTLQYDWLLSEDKSECEIRETYENSEALLEHASHLREALGILFEKFATGGRFASIIDRR